jgi:hypothetical protein
LLAAFEALALADYLTRKKYPPWASLQRKT